MKYPGVLITELQLRGYSEQTIQAYRFWNDRFLDRANKHPLLVRQRDINAFLLALLDQGKKEATRHQAVAALKFYYAEILKRKFRWRYPKKRKHVVQVLTKEEIQAMLCQAKNKKHKHLLLLLYGAGLRVSEVVRLRWEDVDAGNGLLLIRQGKGKKDRYTVLPRRIEVTEERGYLFPGRRGHLAIGTAQQIVKILAKRAGIKQRVHCHLLRASFATHLLGEGYPLWQIQQLLGHARRETTEHYLCRSSVPLQGLKSPLDLFLGHPQQETI